MFTLTEEHLRQLWALNQFPVPEDSWVFFGLRGCLPINDQEHLFKKAHQLEINTPDYIQPRCTIGQWAPGKGFAVFPGSTVPHQRHIKKSVLQAGKGTNQLLTGCYIDYRKGWHKKSSTTGHQAFRQNNKLPVRRTSDDLDFDADDRVEYTTPFDNLHAAWCPSVDHERFASAGCQVVIGFPECAKRDNQPDLGPWKTFKENAYGIPQESFFYVLLNGRDAQRMATSQTNQTPRLRFGSKGELVGLLQQSLKTQDFYEGNIDNDFGPRTLRSVLDFQTYAFGESADDGIVGSMTVSALNLQWPGSQSSMRMIAANKPDNVLTGEFRFDGHKAIAPEGIHFAKKYKKGVYNYGEMSIGTFVRQNKEAFDGISPSLLKIMEAVSENEGMLEAINTWDNAFLTFGVFQWTLGSKNSSGELPALLKRLQEEHVAVFEQYFGQYGLGVTNVRMGPPINPGVKPSGFCTLNGQKLASAAQKEKLRSLEWAYRFWRAGQNDIIRTIQIKQAMDRIHIFYNSPKHNIGKLNVANYVTSEYGAALLLDQHINRPGHVPKILGQAIEHLKIVKKPAKWNDQDEETLLDTYLELRAKTSMTDSDKRAQVILDAVGDGVISKQRGSFII